MGAIVRAFDTRPAVKEQCQSLGAEFLEVQIKESGEGVGGYAKEMSKEFIEAEMALFAKQAKEVDIIITTALIPGKPAPKLIKREMVESMKEGSVIVDLAAEAGGNVEVTRPHETYVYKGVTIIGLTDLPSRMATQASTLYSNNVIKFLSSMIQKDNNLVIDLNDEVVRGSIILKEGEKLWPPPKPSVPSPSATTEKKPEVKVADAAKKEEDPHKQTLRRSVYTGLALGSLLGLGVIAPEGFMSKLQKKEKNHTFSFLFSLKSIFCRQLDNFLFGWSSWI